MVELLSEKRMRELVRRYGSFYIYDREIIDQYTDQLQNDFAGIHFLYSLKANNNPDVAGFILSKGFGADAASLNEVRMGAANGLGQDEIYYSAPGKTDEDIRGAIRNAVLIADSLDEVERINRIAGEEGLSVPIGVRINPDFSFHGSGGRPSKFGIDTVQALNAVSAWRTYANIRVTGIHVHLQSQELDAAILAEYYRRMFLFADCFQAALGSELDFINMGAGMGIQYSGRDTVLDTGRLGEAVREMLASFRVKSRKTKIFIETGRYAVGKAGFYVTHVLDKKTSYGKTFVILANTLNGFLRPSIARLVARYAGNDVPAGSEPLFTSLDAFEIASFRPEWEGTETVTLVGNLCTASDMIAEDIILPVLKQGDPLIISNAGSYGAVLSPMQFSSQRSPAELFLDETGRIYESGKLLEI